MAVKWDVLVGVCGFAVDIKTKRGIRIVNDKDIQHGDPAILLSFDGPFDVGMDGVEVVVEWVDVIFVHCDQCVVGLPQPEENDVTGTDGTVPSGVVGEGSLLEIFHENV